MVDIGLLFSQAQADLEHHEAEVERIKTLLAALRMTDAYAKEVSGEPAEPLGLSAVQMLNQSIHQTLKDFAGHDHGEVTVGEAVDMLVGAGVSPTRAHARTTVHSTLSRSKDFVRVGKSRYRLRDYGPVYVGPYPDPNDPS